MPGLEDLYREIILDHYRTPRNRGELPPPAAHAVGHNPLCGDEIDVYLQVEDGIVTDVKVGGQGCSISQSSASMNFVPTTKNSTSKNNTSIIDVRLMNGISSSLVFRGIIVVLASF
jgi:nitrogen fixation NifU-like protein